MKLPLKERPLCFRLSSELYHAVFESVGAASMCWNPIPSKSEFDSNKASQVATDLCFKIAEAMENHADIPASDPISTALDKFAEAGAKAWTGVEPRSLRGELVWSKEPPTVSGWYWYRVKYWGKNGPWSQAGPTYFEIGHKLERLWCEWAGPIPLPSEPNH